MPMFALPPQKQILEKHGANVGSNSRTFIAQRGNASLFLVDACFWNEEPCKMTDDDFRQCGRILSSPTNSDKQPSFAGNPADSDRQPTVCRGGYSPPAVSNCEYFLLKM